MIVNHSESPQVHHANRTEGSNPFLTDEATGANSNKTPTSRRFWIKVAVRGANECWLWQAYIDQEGYGRFSFDGKRRFAHRAAWILTFGPLPNEARVLHKCDNPTCVNPAHLFIGTHQDNMNDRSAKGRTASGERNGRAKLTWEIVNQIRAAHKPWKVGITKLAAQFGVSKWVVQDILRKRTWREAA